MFNEIWTDQQCIDAVEEALLRLALNQYAQEEGKELLEENAALSTIPEFNMSDKDRSIIDAAIAKQKRLTTWKPILHNTKSFMIQAAVVFLCISAVFYSTMAVSANFRKTIYHLVFQNELRYTQIEQDRDTSAFHDPQIYAFDYAFALTYLPEGFVLSDYSGDAALFEVQYTNDNGNTISFNQMDSSAISRIDTEDAELVEVIEIGESDGLLTIKNGYCIIVWRVGGRMLYLDSDIDKETLLEIANNTRLIH